MTPNDLDAGYRAMAADTARETRAQEWCNAMTREALADVDAGRGVIIRPYRLGPIA